MVDSSVNSKSRFWLEAVILLLVVYSLSVLLPNRAVDSWGFLNPSKFFQLIGAMLTIQILSLVLIRRLGTRQGLILTGLLGGFISSTALTVSLARQSQSYQQKIPPQILPLLSSILAMLLQAFVLVLIGVGQLPLHLSAIFLIPALALSLAIIWLVRSAEFSPQVEIQKKIDLRGILKLVVLIMGILMISKLAEKFVGNAGLQAVTFVISLFEVHGSVMTNSELYAVGNISEPMLESLLTISVIASCVSKLILAVIWGSDRFKKCTAVIVFCVAVATLVGWFL